jgi:uncharacterized protein (DUF362 family)
MNVKQLLPHPRNTNPYTRDGKPLVARVPHLNGDYLPATVDRALELLGGLEKAIQPGDKVMIKPNFNCRYALPLSTDLAFLGAIIEMLLDAGCLVRVGEMSGRADGPTEQVIDALGVLPFLKRYGVPFVNFEEDEWLPMRVDGHYWESFRVPRSIYESEKRVYLANMRCHSSARFTASLKLSVGWTDLQDRAYLHQDRETVEAKVAELNLGWQPDLVLIDGRRSTVTWHGRGEYVYPNAILASGDMVAIDAEAVRTLQSFLGDNKLDGELASMPQLKNAQDHGLGTIDSIILSSPAQTKTEQDAIF